jgi:molybdopterin-guanine dinucleotide biosynthesis protein A
MKTSPARDNDLAIPDDLAIVIQAGGESRRMGRSKATVPFCGEPLIKRIIRRVEPVASELIITTNEAENLSFLAEEGRDDIRLVADLLDVRGALNGLYTALASATRTFVGVVACDMVFASAPLLAYERDILARGDYDAAVPHLTHGYEPFHAVYRREECLKLVDAAIARGECSAQSWYKDANLYLLSSSEVYEADPRGGAFINANTPDELHHLEQRVRDRTMTFASDDD